MKTAANQAPSKATGSQIDAIAMLTADHKAVSALFAKYETTRIHRDKKAIIDQICTALSVHAQIEEEIFYPAVKAALKDKVLVPEATVEHAGVRDLIAKLQDEESDGEMFEARVKVLSEYVKHHVKEEQNEMFPEAKSSSIDMVELGAMMAGRKEELLASAA